MNSLGCKYPIIALAMNQVSDIALAKAIRTAGAIPSLSIFNYANSGLKGLIGDLDEYFNTFGDYKIFLSIGISEIINPRIVDIIITRKIEFVELIPDDKLETSITELKELQTNTSVDTLIQHNVKVFIKCLGLKNIIPNITGVILKGKDGAGRGKNDLDSLFDIIKDTHPNLEIIVSGGIGTPDQVKYYIDKGAIAIGIGTLFSVSSESSISNLTKLKMIGSSSKDITQFTSGAKQNALIFSEVDTNDYNHTAGLKIAISNPDVGHVFVGTAIDHVNEILPVSKIINKLVERLNCE
jgi:NAD(P)H-dependent flavin oxidoreductase YrpB (nitropropane dioxygenase family)